MADYVDWHDLLDDDAAPAPAPAPAPGREQPAAPADLTRSLPPELQALLAEKSRLEDELRAMSGRGKPSPTDARRDRCFPVKVHTRESRIEDRRLARHDEHLRLLAQRAGERAAAERRAEQQRQAERELEAAERRRQWLAARIAAAAAAEVEARVAAEAEARVAAEAESRRRWAEQRRLAALARAGEQVRAALWQEERHDARVAANIVKVAAARRAALWQQERHARRALAVVVRTQARDREQAAQDARADEARAARVAAARELVQSRRREAQRTDQHLDDRKPRRK